MKWEDEEEEESILLDLISEYLPLTPTKNYIYKINEFIKEKKRRIDFINYLYDNDEGYRHLLTKHQVGSRVDDLLTQHKTTWSKLLKEGLPDSMLKFIKNS